MGDLQLFVFPEDNSRRLFPIPQRHIVDGDLRGDLPAGLYLRLENEGAPRPFPRHFPGCRIRSLAHCLAPFLVFVPMNWLCHLREKKLEKMAVFRYPPAIIRYYTCCPAYYNGSDRASEGNYPRRGQEERRRDCR